MKPDPVEVCTAVTDCSSSPCVNGDCIDMPNGNHECQCYNGWSGPTCNVLQQVTSVGISTGVIIAIVVSLLVLLCKYITIINFTLKKPEGGSTKFSYL